MQVQMPELSSAFGAWAFHMPMRQLLLHQTYPKYSQPVCIYYQQTLRVYTSQSKMGSSKEPQNRVTKPQHNKMPRLPKGTLESRRLKPRAI